MSKKQLLHSIHYIRFLRSKVAFPSGDEELDLIWKSILRKVSRRRKYFRRYQRKAQGQ